VREVLTYVDFFVGCERNSRNSLRVMMLDAPIIGISIIDVILHSIVVFTPCHSQYVRGYLSRCRPQRQNSIPIPIPHLQLCLSLPLPSRPPSLLPLRPSNSLSLPSALRSLHALKLLLQHRLERIVTSGQEHDVICVYDFAAAVFGEDFEVAGGVCCGEG